jgi:pimeloyl-ACP methyl ester carboxylesterase/DNA-binding CsgD family transcriptional regulator
MNNLVNPVNPNPKQKIRFANSHDGVRLAWASSGQGPTLIKAATWLSHLEFDWQSPVWRHMLHALSRHNNLVRYDERGCGFSDWNVPELSFASWVRDLDTIVQEVKAERFALLGVSQGAAIAINYAVLHPERVSHLILSGGYARGRLVRSSTPQQREEAEMMCRLAELGWGNENPAFRQFFTSQFIPGGTAAQHHWFNELERISTSPENAARFMRVFNDIDVVDLLPQVQCPTLVLHNQHDVRVPFAEGLLLATQIPDARFVAIDSPNHLLLESEPGWQRWLEEVNAFLQDGTPPAESAVFASLTVRQREVLNLLAQGRDNAQIGALLGMSEKTVRNHITALFDKLGVVNRSQAIVLAREAGFGIGAEVAKR